LAADPNTGVLILGYQARNSTLGYPNAYVFSLLDAHGAIMPSQLGVPYFLIDARAGPTDTAANYHNIKYDPFSHSFVAVATAGGGGSRVVYLGSVTVTSLHLPSVKLTIERNGANVTIRWPASAVGYNLESTPSLTTPSWTPAGGVPMPDGEFLKATVPISGNGFFRLKK
jgi:hypothetical protein